MPETIRLASILDAEAICAIYAPYVESTPISFETEPPSVTEMTSRIESTLRTLPWLVYEMPDGRAAGYTYASAHRARDAYRWSVDVSVYIDSSFHRRGIGRALYTPLLRLLTQMGYYQAFAGITLPNAGSVGLHEAMGFTPVGVYEAVGHKGGIWHDVGWWQLQLRAPSPEPAEPIRLPELLRSLPL